MSAPAGLPSDAPNTRAAIRSRGVAKPQWTVGIAFDDGDVGEVEEWYRKPDAPFHQTIIVPFAYQSQLSGIGNTEVHEIVWYRRTFDAPDRRQRPPGFYILRRRLCRQSMVNGHYVGSHEGGHTRFRLTSRSGFAPRATPWSSGRKTTCSILSCPEASNAGSSI